ncbi:MAG: type II secretion system minor pseudopilin GspI [Sedimenticola sp.]
MFCKRGRLQIGFTLLEVVVALAILGISMAVIIKVTARHADNAFYLESKTVAHWVAMNLWSELQMMPPEDPITHFNGIEVMAKRNWEWSIIVRNTPDRDVQELKMEVREAGKEGGLASLRGYRVVYP